MCVRVSRSVTVHFDDVRYVISISWCYVGACSETMVHRLDDRVSRCTRKCSRCIVVASRANRHTHTQAYATHKYVETYVEMRVISCTSLGRAFTRLTYPFVPCRQSRTKQVKRSGKRIREKKPSAWYLWTPPEARVRNNSRSFRRCDGARWPPYYYTMKIDMSRSLTIYLRWLDCPR